MEPVLRHGRSIWDQALLPADEFLARAVAVRSLAHDVGAESLLLVGDPHEPANLSYLTNFPPTTKWAMLVLGPGEEAAMIAGLGGGRDHAYIRSVSTVHDLYYFTDPGAGISELLESWGVTSGPVAVAGLATRLPLSDYAKITGALASVDLVDIGDAYDRLRRHKRPREIAVMKKGHGVLAAACAKGRVVYARSGDAGHAICAVETEARRMGCHDVRSFVSDGHGSLGPYRGGSLRRPTPTSFVFAGEYLGYWSQISFTVPWGSITKGADPRPALARAIANLGLTAVPDGSSLLAGPSNESEPGRVAVKSIGLSLEESWSEPILGDVVVVTAWSDSDGCAVLASEEVVLGNRGPTPLEEVEP